MGKVPGLLKGISVNQTPLTSRSVFTKLHCHFTTLLKLHGHACSSRTEKEHDPPFLNGMLQESVMASTQKKHFHTDLAVSFKKLLSLQHDRAWLDMWR